MRTDTEKLEAFLAALGGCQGTEEGRMLHAFYSGMEDIQAVQDSLENLLGILYSLQFIAATGCQSTKQC